mgnify:CR=1 FL=1
MTTIIHITILFLMLLLGIALGIYMRHQNKIWTFLKNIFRETYVKLDDTRHLKWKKEFEVVSIPSQLDGAIQKAYFYKTKSSAPKPLIVSLHTWTGYYTQQDEIAGLCLEHDINYIHPDFRGGNFNKDACGSTLALGDIDDAILYAIRNANVDAHHVYLIGGSGGAHAALSVLMKSKQSIRKISVWASIADLTAWFEESQVLRNNYANNILACTESKDGILNEANARERSPFHTVMPIEKLSNTEIFIYHGIYDGIQGSVPITQSINFYNKLLSDLDVKDSSVYVSDSEKLLLLEHRKPLAHYGKIADRRICLHKSYRKISLIIFEGSHEILLEHAFNQLLEKTEQ